jgi:D,D-heptose 1,7-bisphosphate phosphatase
LSSSTSSRRSLSDTFVNKVRAAFVDRDGTINVEKGYVHKIEDFHLIPGTLDALRLLTRNGVKIYIVTNQAGIAKGHFTEKEFQHLTDHMLAQFRKKRIHVENVLYCPHHPDGTVPEHTRACSCRKPGTRLLEEVIHCKGLRPEESVLIGDKESDIETGRRLGLTTYLVLTGHGAVYEPETRATFVKTNLLAAARHIVTSSRMSTEPIDTIILAGGLGTRLRAIIDDRPKALAPVGNRPFLDVPLNFLNSSGCTKNVVIATGHLGDKIENEYAQRSGYGFSIGFSREERLLGTGGAIKKALTHTQSKNVLVMNGDSFTNVSLAKLLSSHIENRSDMTIALKKMADTSRYGNVELDETGRIISFREKDSVRGGGYVNTGIYLFKRELFDEVEADKVLSLEKELLPTFSISKRIHGHVTRGRFIDIGVPETYRVAKAYLRSFVGRNFQDSKG